MMPLIYSRHFSYAETVFATAVSSKPIASISPPFFVKAVVKLLLSSTTNFTLPAVSSLDAPTTSLAYFKSF